MNKQTFTIQSYDPKTSFESEYSLSRVIAQQMLEQAPMSLARIQFEAEFYSKNLPLIITLFKDKIQEDIDYYAANSSTYTIYAMNYNPKDNFEEAQKKTVTLIDGLKEIIMKDLGLESVKIVSVTYDPDSVQQNQRRRDLCEAAAVSLIEFLIDEASKV